MPQLNVIAFFSKFLSRSPPVTILWSFALIFLETYMHKSNKVLSVLYFQLESNQPKVTERVQRILVHPFRLFSQMLTFFLNHRTTIKAKKINIDPILLTKVHIIRCPQLFQKRPIDGLSLRSYVGYILHLVVITLVSSNL